MNDTDIRRTGANGRRSTCVAYNGMLYTSGITTVDLQADMAGQARDVFEQLDKLMAHNGTDKHNILSATIFLCTMDDYGAFNAVWDEWVDDTYEPCRSVIEAGLALPEYKLKVSLVVALPGK